MTTQCANGGGEVIQIWRLIDPRDGVQIGYELCVNGEWFFISEDQEAWPRIRLGAFPILTWDDNRGEIKAERMEVVP